MTLLLSLVSPHRIFQSSDYRLTGFKGGIAVPEEDVAGAKQLSIHSSGLTAQISFTGLARVGSLKTRDWLRDIANQASNASDPIDVDSLVLQIAQRGSAVVRTVSADYRSLTVVLAITQPGRKPRFILVSNIDRLDGPRRARPIDKLEVSQLSVSRARLFVLGFDVGVDDNPRRYLESLIRSGEDVQKVKEALHRLNVHAAKNPNSKGFISEGCMVNCLNRDGSMSAQNFGSVAGIPDSFLGSFNMGEILRKGFPANDMTIRQSQSTPFKPEVRWLEPEGEVRILGFVSPSATAVGIGNDSGGEFDKLRIQGLRGSVSLRKNELVWAVVARIHFEAGPTGPAPGNESELPFFAKYSTQYPLVLDNVVVQNLKLSFDILVDGELHTLKIRQSGGGLRHKDYSTPSLVLHANEEIDITVPRTGLTLSARVGQGAATGDLESWFKISNIP